MAPKILFVLTSHSKMGDTGKETGWYLPEFAHPYNVLAPVADITIASPAGGAAPLDPTSIEMSKDDSASVSFLKDSKALWEKTEKLSSILGHASDYAAIFYVGGHGPMWDLATDETSDKLLAEFEDAGKVIAAVCHGPAALAYAKRSDGEFLIKGKKITAFSNSEEAAVGLTNVVPFALETQLGEAGGVFQKGDDWAANVVVDGRLITGANPASATGVGEAIKSALGL